MRFLISALLLVAVGTTVECARNTPRSARANRNEASLEFECPEEFGYYPHPRDCTQYYVCVFGGALLESCTGGLMYSHELQTCDWPRNVGCLSGGSLAKEAEEDDPLLERAAKVESIQLQHQQQQQHHRAESRQHQRQPIQRQHQQVTVTPSSPTVSQITERQSRHRQPQQTQHQRIYQDEEYEPATEIESDRQQRVYRGQPSTIGQVQRDRDGLRRNIISVSHPTSSTSSSGLKMTRQRIASSYNNIVNQASGRRDRFDNGRQNDFDPNSTSDSVPRRSTIQPSSIDITTNYQRLSYSSAPRDRDFGEGFESEETTEVGDEDKAATVTSIEVPATLLPEVKDERDRFQSTESSRLPARSLENVQQFSIVNPTGETQSTSVTVTTSSRSTLAQPRSRDEVSFSSPSSIAVSLQRNEEFEKNEISVTTPSTLDDQSRDVSTPEVIGESVEGRRLGRPTSYRNVFPQHRPRDDFLANPSSPSWLRSTEEIEQNEISVTPGLGGRGFMIKRLRSDHSVVNNATDNPVTPSYERSTLPEGGQSEKVESRISEPNNPSLNRQRSRNNLISSTFQPRVTEKSVVVGEDRESAASVSTPGKTLFTDLDNRKYYLASISQNSFGDDTENDRVSPIPVKQRLIDDSKTRTVGNNGNDKKYYILPPPTRRFMQDQGRQGSKTILQTSETSEVPSTSTTKTVFKDDGKSSTDSGRKTSTEENPKEKDVNASTITEDPAKNEIYVTLKSSRRNSGLTTTTENQNEHQSNAKTNPQDQSVEIQAHHRSVFRGQTRHKIQTANRRISTSEREKDSVVSTRGQTESHYRAISSESPRTAKTTASTAAPVSKAYYSDADQSYPYYTIYDDDVSIYKDEDYGQYAVNRTEQIPQQHHHQHQQQQQHHQQQQQQQQQQQPQHNHHQHRQQNVRIAEVTPNANDYSQKPKKVSDSNKYNLSPQVTVADYDIYDSEPLKNAFSISDEQQSLRPNGLSHPVVHVTTPNAIVEGYVPLTTTTQPPPTTTARPYTATVQTRGRPQVNRGTAPPRLRPTLKPSTSIVSKAQEFVDIYRHPAVRPPPIYPTPTVDKPAAKCRKDVCLLPDCSCGGPDIPGEYLAEEIPQIVLLTFDDSVNDLNKQLYTDLFEKGRKNPNGCPISASFYVSHEWTDYSQVQNLYAAGHEIASHTVSHSFGEQFSARKWSREIAGQREILAAYGGVKLEDVRGMRAPFLSVGGNNMFKMLWDTNFTYDSSMPIYENRPPSWPYTLDYKLFHDCMIPPCPTRSYPGLWEVPMVMWQDLNGGRCSMGDACSNPPTPDGVYKMLIKNFERHYTTNRAPFGLFYHAAWFTQPHHKEGFISFLDTITAMDDVWIITNWQALQWMRNPTPLQQINSFEPFGCNYADRPKKCNNAKVCNLWHKSGVRYMKTCQPCPDIYPWTGKTGIPSSRIDNEIEN